MDSKLKCVFVMPMPDSNNVTANGAATSETSKPASEFHAATNSAVSATQAMTSSSSPKVGIYNPALYLHSSSPRFVSIYSSGIQPKSRIAPRTSRTN